MTETNIFLFIPYIKNLTAVIIGTENWGLTFIQNKCFTKESFGTKLVVKLGEFVDTIKKQFV